MKSLITAMVGLPFLLAFLLLAPTSAEEPKAAEVPAEPIAKKGERIFFDDFDRDNLGEWKPLFPSFVVKNGILTGKQDREDHGAVGRLYRPMKDVVLEFKFRLTGSTVFNAAFDDQAFKNSHAGHICRAAFTSKSIRLGDDKEGAMRNDIFEMRKDPARKAEATKLLVGRSSTALATLEQQKWYHVSLEIIGDRMRLCLDGKPTAYLKSPGIAHATKSSFHFTVNGPGVEFDDVRIWNAE